MVFTGYTYGLWLMHMVSIHYMAAVNATDWLALLSLPAAVPALVLGWLVAMTWPLAPLVALLSEPRRATVIARRQFR